MFVSCHSRERLLPQAQPFTGARTTQAHGAESVESWQPRKATKMTLLDPKTEEKLLDTARADLVETEARIAKVVVILNAPWLTPEDRAVEILAVIDEVK